MSTLTSTNKPPPPRVIHPEYLISLFLIFSTYIVYQQIQGHPFIEYDTSEYVTNNRYVRAGLTIEGLQWAFFSSYFANWHPITWLSHMLDVELYGLSAGLHHLTNLLLHISNSLLLFFFLTKSTKKPLASWLVAGIFALHPLHVESVAWVAERKDVLSCFLGLLALTSYTHYTKTKNRWPYCLALLFFSLGLMAKPILVTLPALFIVLDYWPLNRWLDTTSPSCHSQVTFRKIFLLFLEKIPFLILAAISCTITLQVQNIEHNIASLTSIPLDMRFADATTSYVKYIIKAFWPLNLAILYPAQHHTGTWSLLFSVIFLAGTSITVFLFRYSRPWLLTGWLWYIGTLVPVIGLISIGEHDIADRYTYIPLTGLTIMVAYSIDDKVSSTKQKKQICIFITMALCLLSILTWRQVSHWKTTISLYEHTLEKTSNNWIMHNNLGRELMQNGQYKKAANHFKQALLINPKASAAFANLAMARTHQGNLQGATKLLFQALDQNPNYTYGQNGLVFTLALLRKKSPDQYQLLLEKIRVDYRYKEVYMKLGKIFLELGDTAESCRIFETILQDNPKNKQAIISLRQQCNSGQNNGNSHSLDTQNKR